MTRTCFACERGDGPFSLHHLDPGGCGAMFYAVEPLQKIRPIIGPVNPMPCSNENCPGLTVLGGDDDPDLMTVLELYRGCVIKVTIELIEGPA